MRSSYIVGIIVALFIGVVFYMYSNGTPDVDEEMSEETASENTDVETDTNEVSENATSEDEEFAAVIAYTAEGFSPTTVTVETGETLQFVNESGEAFWPASDVHPTHTQYNGTSRREHCGDGAHTAFDACRPVESGESYSFTFTKAGTWGYHDHLEANNTGTIIVE